MKQQIVNNLKSKYQNQIDIAKTNIDMFLASPQGVAEHIDFSETIEKELEKIAHANDMLEALAHLTK
tara:strand:- start:7108 stop:7308 length:201 start_codon:yes stop_codon:yes gene_type:complete